MRERRRARRLHARLGLLPASGCLAFAVAGCAQPHPTLSDLRQVPEVSLHPPGAVLVRRGGVDSDRRNFGGANPAILTDLYATDDAPAAVVAYYRSHLGDGWTEDRNAGVRRTEWSDADAWESADYLLQIGIDSADYRRAAATVIPGIAGRRTLFMLSLQSRSDGD